jgi:hypothetical protein
VQAPALCNANVNCCQVCLVLGGCRGIPGFLAAACCHQKSLPLPISVVQVITLCRRVILGCLAAAPPLPAGSAEAAAEAVVTPPPPPARAALRCLSLEAVWRLLLAARAAGGCASGQRPAAAARPVDEVRCD